MDNVVEEVYKLKEEIKKTKEYTDYIKYLNLLEKENDIKKLIGEIKKVQKEIVNLSSKNLDKEKEEIKLDILFNELNSNKIYKEYINASKKLNKLITEIQNKFSIELDKILD